MNLFSHFLHTMKKAWSISACISLLIGGPFLCANVHAANAPTSVMRPPQVVAYTQQNVQQVNLGLQKGVLNDKNICDPNKQGNEVVSEFYQDASASYFYQNFQYFIKFAGLNTWNVGSHTHRMLHQPATYDIRCARVNPQVGWKPSQ